MRYRNQSFSIVELLIVVSILALMSGLAIGHLRNRSEKELLRAEAQKIAEAVHFAKKSAQTGLNPGKCDYYTGDFVFSWSSGGYKVSPQGCDPLLTYKFSNEDIIIKTVEEGRVTFKVFDGRPDSQKTLTVKHKKTNECVEIEITTAGTAMPGNVQTCQ